MDLSYIEQLISEMEYEMSKALNRILSPDTTDIEVYQYQKGRYHALRSQVASLKARHAID